MFKGLFRNNKKFLVCLLAILIVVFIMVRIYKFVSVINQNTVSTFSETYIEPDIPTKNSIEEMYQDIFMTLLQPYIDKAVEDYYGYSYNVAPYSTKVLSVERPNGYRTFVFLIKLKVLPYSGAHIAIGIDHITFRISSGPNVEIKKFEHIKSYKLPPQYN